MWRKRGRLFEPARQAPWIGTHASLPTPERIDDRHRVYFSSRDAHNRSHIGFCDVSLADARVLGIAGDAVLSPGALGTFDDAGVTPAAVVKEGERVYLYYTGWSLGVSVPFYLNAGLATSDSGGAFIRVSEAPLLERNAVDPYLTASPWVLLDQGRWRMWYVSGTGWERIGGAARHRYHIKYAESSDGVRWDRSGLVCIDYRDEEEYAFGRPCVLRDGGCYRMWFSSRGDRYRLGYAESADGVTWRRKDHEAGLDVSPEGWDSEMIAYPAVVRDAGGLQMLYNGNGYGRTGIGLATSA